MKKQRALMMFILPVLLLVAVGALCLWQAHRQYARARQLIVALEQNDVKQALELVNSGADPNTHVAPPLEPSLSDLPNLILHGSLPSIDHYCTAFALACGVGCDIPDDLCVGRQQRPEDVELIQSMLVHGADPNAHVQIGGPVINVAVSLNHVRVAELLVAHGANVNYYGGGAGTPLISAIENKNTHMVHLLLTHGADVNMKNSQGRTPLHSAVISAVDKPIIEQLLAHGADVTQLDGAKRTPLWYAQTMKRPDLVALLRKGEN